MTIIAWDGRSLAADKLLTSGGNIGRCITKIEKYSDARGEVLFAIAGDWDIGIQLQEWWKAGASIKEFPACGSKEDATLIVIYGGEVLTYVSAPFPLKIEATKCAFGSGRDYAEAALYLGKTAVEAVEIACMFQIDCGYGVDVLTFTETAELPK